MSDMDILGRKRSVTIDDIEAAQGPGVLHVLVGPADYTQFTTLIPQTGLPIQTAYPYPRDVLLSATVLMDNMWAVSMKKAISKQVALGWTVDDSKDIGTRTRRAQAIIENFDGDFEQGLQKHLRDFLTCDNGAWIEIARATRGGASRVEGIYHLDSLRVQRTRDPNIPAYYQTLRDGWKPLPAEFVANFTDMPSPRVEMAGVGLCAASTAWDTIVKMAAVETYFREKVTGSNQKAIYLISGVTRKQLKEGIESADAEAVSKGIIVYKGAVLIPGFDGEHPPAFVRIDLSSIPDAFDINQERDRSDRIYAHALGVFIGDIQPLTGQGLGNGQQARLLEESAEAMGLAAWRKQFATFTKRINPTTTTFAWSTNDVGDRLKLAELQEKQIANIVAMLDPQLINVPQGQQLLLDAKILPKELAPRDLTPGGTLTDEEQAGDATQSDGAQLAGPIAPTVEGAKAAGHTGVMIALYPDTRAAKYIAGLDGVTEPVEDLHLTLAFLGDSTQQALATNKQRIVAAIKEWATAKGKPLKGVINGLGRFYNTESDGTNAVYVSPDVPGLPELRQSLVQVIEATGIDYAQNHGFTPHLTVAYVPEAAPTPNIRPDIPVMFTAVTLAWGDEHLRFPLGIGAATKASPVMANEPPKLTEEELRAAWRLLNDVLGGTSNGTQRRV